MGYRVETKQKKAICNTINIAAYYTITQAPRNMGGRVSQQNCLGEDQTVKLELRNESGDLVARAAVPLRSRAHVSRFVTEFPWDNSPDFSKFSGTVTAIGTSEMAAIALRLSPGTLAAIPIVEKP